MPPSAGPGSAAGSHAAVLAEPIAHPPDRLQRLHPERPIDLLAQVADVDLHDVRAVLVAEIPRGVDQLALGEDVTRSAHERLQQRELPCRQLNLRVPAPDLTRRRIETQ